MSFEFPRRMNEGYVGQKKSVQSWLMRGSREIPERPRKWQLVIPGISSILVTISERIGGA